MTYLLRSTCIAGLAAATFALGACQSTGTEQAAAENSSEPMVTAATAQSGVEDTAAAVRADSIDEFNGTWKGRWVATTSNNRSNATVNIRPGASVFANADFALGNGVSFRLAPDYEDGRLVVDNGAMDMTITFLGDKDHLRIDYERGNGNAGYYLLERS